MLAKGAQGRRYCLETRPRSRVNLASHGWPRRTAVILHAAYGRLDSLSRLLLRRSAPFRYRQELRPLARPLRREAIAHAFLTERTPCGRLPSLTGYTAQGQPGSETSRRTQAVPAAWPGPLRRPGDHRPAERSGPFRVVGRSRRRRPAAASAGDDRVGEVGNRAAPESESAQARHHAGMKLLLAAASVRHGASARFGRLGFIADQQPAGHRFAKNHGP